MPYVLLGARLMGPLVLEEGQHCKFSERKSQASGFNKETIGQLLCIMG